LLSPYRLRIGHATDLSGGTGCTVLLGEDGPFRAACHVLGRATGTRELHTLHPDHLVDRVDAILLTGGSAYGLDAASGLMSWLERQGRGLPIGDGVVPIVPAAVIFDLSPVGRFDARPTSEMAIQAAESAVSDVVEEGSVGAGTGATVGKALGRDGAMKGGFGVAEVVRPAGRAVAMTVVNAFGDVVSSSGEVIAGARRVGGDFADTSRVLGDAVGSNTVLSVVAVDRPVPRVELQELARASAGALHRRIRPAGTLLDGDVIFAVCPLPGADEPIATPDVGEQLALATLCSEALEIAVERAVRMSKGISGIPGLADA
jgi:L-aminopeptidase/D-esterase-like protein